MVDTTISLSNGIPIPTVGLGTSRLRSVTDTVLTALVVGYRHIDTAKMYGNEEEIGEALTETDVPREEIFVTTKLWRDDLGYDSALENVEVSLKRLGLTYVDLYLIHWPGPPEWTDRRKETWRAMEELYGQGLAKAIGVSNYTVHHMQEVEAYANVPPMVNQIEFHPFLYQAQRDIHTYCRERGIVVTSYSPLMRGNELDNTLVEHMAKKYNRSATQVLLRWNIQHGNVIIPKASSREHLAENIDIFDFEITGEDMEQLDTIGGNHSFLR